MTIVDMSMWDAPQSEFGLMTLVSRLTEQRRAGNAIEVGKGLLALARLVVWVRSDNDEPPFSRAETLSREALEVFRKAGYVPGQVAALRAVAKFESPQSGGKMLDEAMRLATELGDRLEVARTIAAQARQAAFADPARSRAMQQEALQIFEELQDAGGQAGCHFALAISPPSPEERIYHGLQAARWHRQSGDLNHAAKSVLLITMFETDPQQLLALEPELWRAVADAQAAMSRSDEASLYAKLAEIATIKHDTEAAARLRLWAEDIRSSDGLSEDERRALDARMAAEVGRLAAKTGNEELAKIFQRPE
jgi:hypothetical protein